MMCWKRVVDYRGEDAISVVDEIDDEEGEDGKGCHLTYRSDLVMTHVSSNILHIATGKRTILLVIVTDGSSRLSTQKQPQCSKVVSVGIVVPSVAASGRNVFDLYSPE